MILPRSTGILAIWPPLRHSFCGAAVVLVVISQIGYAAGPEFRVRVAPQPIPRGNTPTLIRLPVGVPATAGLTLINPSSGARLPAQRLREQPDTACFILPELPANAAAEFVLQVEQSSDVQRDHLVVVEHRDGQVIASVRGNEVLRYNAATVAAPPEVPDHYARSGYIHPLRTPGGVTVTGDFPADHLHQHALFFAWVNTRFEDKKIDFWNQAKQEGRIEHREVVHTQSGAVFGEFVVKLVHLDATVSKPTAVLHEEWHVRVYDVQKPSYVIDFQSTQTCVRETALEILPYHYGGFAFRGRSDWLGNPDHDFLTSLGQGRAEGNHSRPRWVDAYGPAGGQPVGLAILGHPGNFRSPQPVRLHPSKPYFCFSPQALGGFTIEPGEAYVSRYRLLPHDGTPSAANLHNEWHCYAEMTGDGAAQASD